MDIKQLEKIAKALSDSNRLTILQEMALKGGCIQCAQIAEMVNLAQPSVSHHIKTLTEAGLIEPEKEGRCYSYKINRPLIKEYVKEIGLFTAK
jgi:ArsR family transcriptional regulator, arsenate/arsenite/antimonite-responsive transcriptional repressor